MELEKKNSYIPALDGIRAYAVIAVMLHHQFLIFAYGNLGVQVFFVLSGFLITSILLHSKESDNYFKVFYLRRSIRIFPIYYLAFCLVIFYALFAKMPLDDYLHYLFYLQNYEIGWKDGNTLFPEMFNHTWSLAVEEQFYLVWPLLIWIVDRKYLVKTITTIVLISFAVKIMIYFYHPGSRFNYMNTISNLDSLAGGSLLSVYARNVEAKKLLRYLGIFAIGMTIVYVVGSMTTGSKLFWQRFAHHGSLEWLWLSVWILPLISYFIFYMVNSSNTLIRLFFCNKVILYLGKISYGLYLFHYIIFNVVEQNSSFFLSLIPVSIPLSAYKFILTIAIAVLSWHLFESPVLALKKYFSYKNRPAGVGSAVA